MLWSATNWSYVDVRSHMARNLVRVASREDLKWLGLNTSSGRRMHPCTLQDFGMPFLGNDLHERIAGVPTDLALP